MTPRRKQRRTEMIDESHRLRWVTSLIDRLHDGEDGSSPEGFDRLLSEGLIGEYVNCIETGDGEGHHHGEFCYEVLFLMLLYYLDYY